MKKILVLGAGLVAGPLVRYLLGQEGFSVTVASRTLAKAEKLVGGAENGSALQLDVKNTEAVEELVRDSDLAISLLPYVYHPLIAGLCVKHKKQMVTTSYVKDEMRKLDSAAKTAGVILLNEVGVDPGIDHMSAMRVIDEIKQSGGKLIGFSSWCGGLPAPDSNDNPFGYKFSWSPRGVLLAGKNPARYLKEGEVFDIPGKDLFEHHWPVDIEGFGKLEGYTNRDCLPYMDTYGISGVSNMFRGTLRYPGWCETMRIIAELGFLDESKRSDLEGLSFRELTAKLVGSTDVENALAKSYGLGEDSHVISWLTWLGLLGNEPLPAGDSLLDVLVGRMLDKMQYAPGQRDMLVMQHEFVAQYPDRSEKIISTLIDYGQPDGDSSMSRLVGLPAAIAAKLVLCGEIDLSGVQVPVIPEIYAPVLAELEQLGVSFAEKRRSFS